MVLSSAFIIGVVGVGSDVDRRGGSGGEVGAFENGKGNAVPMTKMTNDTPEIEVSDRLLHHHNEEKSRLLRHVSPIVARPSPLMAASFPWDRESAIRAGKSIESKAIIKDKETEVMSVSQPNGDEVRMLVMMTTAPFGCERGTLSTFWKIGEAGHGWGLPFQTWAS